MPTRCMHDVKSNHWLCSRHLKVDLIDYLHKKFPDQIKHVNLQAVLNEIRRKTSKILKMKQLRALYDSVLGQNEWEMYPERFVDVINQELLKMSK